MRYSLLDRWRRVGPNSKKRRLSSKRDCESRRRSAETAEQTAARRFAERSQSQRRRQAQKSANDFEAALVDIDNASCIACLAHSCRTLSANRTSTLFSKVFF